MYNLFKEKEVKNFEDVQLQLQEIEKCMMLTPSYSLKGLTFKRFREVFGEKHNDKLSGLYLITNEYDDVVYVNHSEWLAKDIGEHFRQLSPKKAPLTYKMADMLRIKPIEAREIIEERYSVRFVVIKDIHLRSVSEVYFELNHKAQYSNYKLQ